MFNAVLKWIGSELKTPMDDQSRPSKLSQLDLPGLEECFRKHQQQCRDHETAANTYGSAIVSMAEKSTSGKPGSNEEPFKSTSDKPTGIAELSKLLDNLLSLLEDPTDALELGADDDTPPTEAPENPEGGSGTEIGKKNKKKKKKKKNGDKTTTQGTSSESGVNARYRQDTATTLVNDDLVDQGHVKDSHISLADSTERLSGIPYVSSPMSSTATLV
ncbi:hypothetical protein M231_07888 [Tremella mesenterica]|uniref:Uncharacterized protein n=1 Tax=Tremella mesenterica TaxID=5217 RepID=A0A4V1M2X3_TREME|nr:hypothetical protein M231_07888 [Tremella mesenterica]